MATAKKTPAQTSKTTEVAHAAQTAMAMSDDMPDFLKNQNGPGRGSEEVGADDLTIPRLELVQDLSPCRKRNDPAYIEGIEEGMLYNNVTRQNYGESVLIVPVYFRKEYLIWKDRNEGGGFRGAFPTQEAAEAARADLEDGDMCEVIDTAQHFCLLIDPANGKAEEIVISMNKSKMKVSRKLNSLIRMNGGDSFSRVYRVTAVAEKNSKNQDFFNFSVAPAGYPTREVYQKAESMYDAVRSGARDVSRAVDDSGAPGEGGEY